MGFGTNIARHSHFRLKFWACYFCTSTNPSLVELGVCSASEKSLMAEWLDQVSLRHEMFCHDMQFMSSNPGWVELGVCSTSVLSRT